MIGVMYADMTNGAISVQELFHDPLGQGLTGGGGAASADQLMYWDPEESSNYVTLYLYSSTATTSAAMARKNKWLCSVKPNDTTWGTKANEVSPKIIPAGRGIWYKRISGAGAFTLNLDQPYSL